MIRVVISPEALDDLRDIANWIARDAPLRAVTFLERIKSKLGLIGENPGLGRRRDELGPGIRASTQGKYMIFYRLRADDVEIVRIMHGHRDFRRGLH